MGIGSDAIKPRVDPEEPAEKTASIHGRTRRMDSRRRHTAQPRHSIPPRAAAGLGLKTSTRLAFDSAAAGARVRTGYMRFVG